MRKNKNSVWVKSGAAGVALLATGLSGLAMAGPPISLTVEMQDGCPKSVTDTSNSCPPGLAGEGVACATPGATNVRWSSSSGETITIIFKGEAPEGFSQSNGGSSGTVSGTISASAAAGTYSYGVKGPTCELDPKIIVTR